jgi:rare lipoprotein A
MLQRLEIPRSVAPCVAALLLMIVAAGCQVPSRLKAVAAPEQRDGPPLTVPAGLADLPDPEVVELSRSRYGNPETYTVAGRSYRVMDTSRGYVAEGNASWYGRKFHGRRTSSGEPFDMFALTAAHRSLPIPAFARVTNLQNGRSTVVKINDRGPFHDDRIIDLSYAAAVKLDFHGSGTARVKVEVLEPPREFYLQAGAFSTLAAADALKGRIEQLTGQRAFVVKVPGDALYRVRVGPVKGRGTADEVASSITSAALAEPRILPF